MNLFSRLLGSIYLNCVSRHHQYCSTHWVDFICLVCGSLRPYSVWLSDLFVTLGYRDFYCFLHPLEALARQSLLERAIANQTVISSFPDFIRWKTVLEMIHNKEHLTNDGFERISRLVPKDRP
jgi:hypothetical protein